MANNLSTASSRFFGIAELARLMAVELAAISKKSTLNLACTSQHLEDPVLSALWEKQLSFCTLLEVLPEPMLDREDLGNKRFLVR